MKVALACAWRKKIPLNIYVTCLFGRLKSMKIIMLTGLGRTFAHRTFSTSNVIEFSRFFLLFNFQNIFPFYLFLNLPSVSCRATNFSISHFFFYLLSIMRFSFYSNFNLLSIYNISSTQLQLPFFHIVKNRHKTKPNAEKEKPKLCEAISSLFFILFSFIFVFYA